MAMFQPEIATTWLTPAVVNAAARSRSTRSRRPIRIPAASPASGSGRTPVSASGCAAPKRLEPTRRVIVVPGDDLDLRVRYRANSTDPLEVLRHRANPAAVGSPRHHDPIARHDGRVARAGWPQP